MGATICDLAEYLVPVHADTPAIDAILLDDFDDKANPLGMKGIGELGVCGTGAAVANAVFNATGVRVRDFPSPSTSSCRDCLEDHVGTTAKALRTMLETVR